MTYQRPRPLNGAPLLLVSLVVAAALLGSAGVGFAQPSRVPAGVPTFSIGGFRANGGGLLFTDVAFDIVNRVYLVVGGKGFAQGQFISEDGTTIGSGPYVLSFSGYAHAIGVAYSSDAAAFLVVWVSDPGTGTRPVIGAFVKYNPATPAAATVSSPFVISPAGETAYTESLPAAAYSPETRTFLVTWTNMEPTARGQMVGLSGELVGSPINIATGVDSAVAYNPAAQEFLVSTTRNGRTIVSASRVHAWTGAVLTSDAVVGSAAMTYLPAVIYNARTGTYMVFWSQPTSSTVAARVVGADGVATGSVIAVSNRIGSYDHMHAAYNPVSNTSLVVGGWAYEIGAQEVLASGNPETAVGSFQATVIGTTDGTYAPRVATHTVRREWTIVTSLGYIQMMGQRIQTATADGTGAPGVFGKSAPSDDSYSQGTSPTLSWGTAPGAISYEYCLSASATCASGWTSVGAATSAGLAGLADATTYYWQVRARNAVGASEANGGTWWRFTTGPQVLAKISPANGATVSGTTTTLSWTVISNATYSVCLDTVDNDWCDTGWVAMGAATSALVSSLTPGTYFWQVQAATPSGAKNADNGTWWRFVVPPPAGSLSIDMSYGSAPNGSWVFAEGAQGLAQGFSTYYLIANENAGPVHVRGWVVREGSTPTTAYVEFNIPAFTRRSVDLASIVGPAATGSYSAVFQSIPYAPDGIPSGRQIYVARSMYWGTTGGILTGPGHGTNGTYISPGAGLPMQWYFAEGTRVTSPVGVFETCYSVFNPSSVPVTVQVEFFSDNGTGILKIVTQTLAAQSRWTLSASDIPELAFKNFSARIFSATAGVGVVAERSMYWGANWSGGHTGAGGTAAARDWYFAEGSSQYGFDTYYTLFNPSGSVVIVDATYQLSPLWDGTPQLPILKSYIVQPYSRKTIFLYTEVGYQPGVASRFQASDSIVVERSEYWGVPWSEGSTTVGARAPAVEWHLPEGSTQNGYETFLCLSNPNPSEASVEVTTYSDAGVAETHTVTVGAQSRLTLWMANTTATPNHPVFSSVLGRAFAFKIVSTGASPLPIVAEEAVYWNRLSGAGQFWRGGDALMGSPVLR